MQKSAVLKRHRQPVVGQRIEIGIFFNGIERFPARCYIFFASVNIKNQLWEPQRTKFEKVVHIWLEMKWEYIKRVEAVHPSHRQARVLVMFLPFYTLEAHMVDHDVFPNLQAHISVDVLLLSRDINKVIVTLDVATLIASTTLRFLGCCSIVSSKCTM